MAKVKIKVVNVTNRDNVLMQVPKWVCDLWELQNGDQLDMDMDVSEFGKTLIIKKHVEGEE